MEEVDGRTELPDLSQSLHELEVNVAHQVDAAIEEAEELVMPLGTTFSCGQTCWEEWTCRWKHLETYRSGCSDGHGIYTIN